MYMPYQVIHETVFFMMVIPSFLLASLDKPNAYITSDVLLISTDTYLSLTLTFAGMQCLGEPSQ